MFQIYKIDNKTNEKYYIGLHNGDIFNDNYYGSGKLVKQAVSKYGVKSLDREIITQFKDEELAKWFEKCIVGTDVVHDGLSYNIVVGGGGYASGENHPMYGIKRPPRRKDWAMKISKANSGENAHFYGKKRPKHSKRMTGDNNPMKRKEVSEKFKGEGNPMYGTVSHWRGKKRPEHAKRMVKKIIQMDENGNELKVWPSLKSAARFYGVSTPSISACLAGKTKTSAGYKWKFK